MPKLRASTTYRGRVQGVGFRATTRQIAARFRVTGFVRNEPDGSVLCVAEGEPSELDAFLEAVHDAMRCNIADVETVPGVATDEFATFSIRRG
ncbi:MAG: acylphosphatase [Phycisphaerae bacterium]|nr:acylphosphatase [Phycisphaerae bacterium]